MNVGVIKFLSYATSVGALGGIGLLAYDHFQNERDASYFDRDRASEVLRGVEPEAPPVPVALDYARDVQPAMVAFDWTGRIVAPDVPLEQFDPEVVDEPAVPVEDLLEVIHVLADTEDPGESLCLVRFIDAEAQPRERWYAIGSTLPPPEDHVSVARIFAEGVEFSFADETRPREVVGVSASKTAGSLIVSVADASMLRSPKQKDVIAAGSEPESTAPARTEVRGGQYYVGTEDAAMFAQSYSDILANDVQSRTYYEDGRRAGVELTEVRAGSIAARHGAQSGDVVISINGHPVSSQQEAIAFAKQNSDRYSVWEVQVLRLGRVETIVYHSPD